jgi:DNA-binding protein YbaB
MILDAVKDALSKSTKLAQKKMSQAAGGFPGMGLMGKMGFPGF